MANRYIALCPDIILFACQTLTLMTLKENRPKQAKPETAQPNRNQMKKILRTSSHLSVFTGQLFFF